MRRFEAKAKARARRKQTRKKQAGGMQAQRGFFNTLAGFRYPPAEPHIRLNVR